MTSGDGAPARVRLRLAFGEATRLGPGKADLLELIGETGSISAAGRKMGMSYKRAWSLVEEMNGAFREPLVERVRGGANGGGAHLTAAGTAVLASYRRLEGRVAEAGAGEIARIGALLKDPGDG